MGTQQEPVTGTVLAWAIDESGYAVDDVASRLKVSKSTVQQWIDETDRPTVGQLTRLANYLKRPRLLFFLPSPPPPEESTASYFRQAATQIGSIPLTPAEWLVVRRARRIQNIVSSLMCLDAQRPIAIPRVAIGHDDPVAVGNTLRKWVAPYDTSEHRHCAQWREEFQERGILVLTLPIRQGNKHAPSSLRGFALSDPYAPAIAINTADNLAARSFTLFHELAHLATDTVQSCGPTVAPYKVPQDLSAASRQERWCDAVAGSALMPPNELDELVKERDYDHLWLDQEVAARFKISFRAAAVSLIQAEAIPSSAYREVEQRWPLLDRTKDDRRIGRGRSRARVRVDEWGKRGIRTLFAAYDRRRISETTLRRWLDMAGPEIEEARALAQVVD